MKRATFVMASLLGASTAHAAPIVFEQNNGQSHADVRFLSRGSNDAVFLSQRGLSLVTVVGEDRIAQFRMDLPGAAPTKWSGDDPLKARIHYLIGRHKNDFVRNVPTFRQVRAEEVWGGVDVVYRLVDQGRVRFDFELRTPAAHRAIRLRFPGATHVAALGEEARIENDAIAVRMFDVRAWQERHGRRIPVDVRFVKRDGDLGFEIGPHDPDRPLTIDPTIDYSTYLGGDGIEMSYAVDLDAAQNAYVGGSTNPLVVFYPTTAGAYQTTPAEPGNTNGRTATLSKIDPTLSGAASLVYSTFIGNPVGQSEIFDVSIDTTGRAHLVGHPSNGFPTTVGAQQTSCAFSQSFAAIISADGSALDYSTCLFTGDTRMSVVEAHPNGHTIIAGVSTRTTPPVAGTNHPVWDALIMRIDSTAAAGAQFVYEATIGGSETERLQDLVLDSQGRVVIVTPARAGAPTTPGAYQLAPTDIEDLYIAKIDTLQPPQSSLVWATYAGGPGSDDAGGGGSDGFAIDAADNIYVATRSNAFPTTPGTISPTAVGNTLVFKLSANGQQLVWATYLGIVGTNLAKGIDVGPNGEIVVTGRGIGFPLSTCAAQTTNSGAYVVRINSDATAFEYTTYLPGTGTFPQAVRVGNNGEAFIVGEARGNNTIPVVGGVQTTPGGAGDAVFQVLGTTADCNPGPCGAITFAGECSGTALTYCEDEDTSFERLVTVDCRTEAFPAGIDGVCTLIDPTYGFDCAVTSQQQCNFIDNAGDPIFGLCDGNIPGCVIDPTVGTASCQPGVGTCDEATFTEQCIGTYLLTDCQVVQPVALDCAGLGATCTGARCTDVQQGLPCDATSLICDPAFVCHDPTDTCETPASICIPDVFANLCEGSTLVTCGARRRLVERIDCPTVFGGRGAITCGAPFTCSGRGCADVDVACVGSANNDGCDLAENLFCGTGRSCVYERSTEGALVGRCRMSNALTMCGVGDRHVGCQDDIATFCIGNMDATAVEPGGFDCGAVGSTCAVIDETPVCVGGDRAPCQLASANPATLYRCADGFECSGATATVLGTCIEVGARPDGGSTNDGGETTRDAGDPGTVRDGGVNTPPVPVDEGGCGCSTRARRPAAPTWWLLFGLLALSRPRTKQPHE